MFWVIFLVFLLLILVYLLLIPIELEFNTYTNNYILKIKGLVQVELKTHPKYLFYFLWKTPLVHGAIYPLKHDKVGRKSKALGKKKSRSFKMPKLALIRSLVKEIKVNALWIEIDTGSYVKNAQLSSITPLLRSWGIPINVNFLGQTNLILSIYSRPIYFLKGFINYKRLNYGITF